MHSSPHHPAIDPDETLPERGFASISTMIADTLATMSAMSADETWPNVVAPERAARDLAFVKTF